MQDLLRESRRFQPNVLGVVTPEAITAVNTFRACHYLRAMAIWGLWATETDWTLIPGADTR